MDVDTNLCTGCVHVCLSVYMYIRYMALKSIKNVLIFYVCGTGTGVLIYTYGCIYVFTDTGIAF